MNLDYLRYFIDAVEYGSVTKAAAMNNISQQGLSRAIRCLEIECDTEFVDRRGRTFKLTAAGKVFLEHARTIVEDCVRMRGGIAPFNMRRQTWNRTVRVYSTVNINYHLWSFFSRELAKRLPDVLFSVVELPLDQVINKVGLEVSDNVIGFVSMPEIYRDNYFKVPVQIEPILNMHLMARVGKNSRFATCDCITHADLMENLLVLYDDEWLKRMLESMLDVSLEELGNVLVQSNNTAIIEEGLQQFDAIGFSNSFACYYLQDSAFKILPIEGAIETPACLLFNKLVADDSFIKNLHKTLIAIAQGFPLASEPL